MDHRHLLHHLHCFQWVRREQNSIGRCGCGSSLSTGLFGI